MPVLDACPCVTRFIHLKKYRAKAGLTTAGSASEGTPVQKASAAAKETGREVKNVKAKPSTKAETEAETVATADKKAKDVLNSPELADKKSDAEKWEANGKAPEAQKSITPEGVSAMGNTCFCVCPSPVHLTRRTTDVNMTPT